MPDLAKEPSKFVAQSVSAQKLQEPNEWIEKRINELQEASSKAINIGQTKVANPSSLLFTGPQAKSQLFVEFPRVTSRVNVNERTTIVKQKAVADKFNSQKLLNGSSVHARHMP